MQWNKLLTTKRYGHEELTPEEIGRSHFHKDHDRIIFSSAFRRLGRKTQVHPLALNDHIHTRLTHSIEVGSLGRSLGIRVGELLQDQLPGWISPHDLGTIVQSACLAHDIGNPPFGHAGEYAIRDWFKHKAPAHYLDGLTREQLLDLQTFEGNAQGFRVVTRIENHLFDGGLRLTYPTLGTLLKYPWTVEQAGSKGKFSSFTTELEILNALGRELGLVQLGTNHWCRHPLAYLVEAADDICYAILDLEDAIELNILGFNDIKPILLQLCGDLNYDDEIFATQASARRKISALRGKAMENMVESTVAAFMANLSQIMVGQYTGELLADGDPQVQAGLSSAKLLARDRVFPDNRKAELEVGAYTTLGTLLDAFCEAAYELHTKGPDQLSYRSQKIISLMGIHCPGQGLPLYHSYMRVLDFIGGMTDNYAAYLARQIGGMSVN
ncbi:deoxyguanosinetriphosphate triphosphohydrolase [Amphritea balenae]|uniref:Deoxyguanosinetriphosphate triphosphohydrolase n=1 Tax=Amphritea balenae TaxID=452629 RepID=A0A3P1ST57_9GAMM|nr:deoxyguanosinetriphosphate triphosphohydrolase [Amphritea balenae]RRD00372.1 deoxyguanosinetriphosphate triphosphohydrolase [Amphritea balenae]GGK85995.1 deoxyguanosinetriphosphate triphosphohydrolase-like protein [Amphritea balenae]